MLLVLGSFAGVIPTPMPVQEAEAISAPLKLPVPAGPAWVIGQGYNTRQTDGGSHWNCDPKTLKDQPTQTTPCRAHYQYQYALDLARADGNTSYQPVLAPANGVIRWIDLSTGGMSIDLEDGYAFAFFHAELEPGLTAGMRITTGQRLGVVSPPGLGGNGGWPHLHINLWRTNDGGNWDRQPVPFTGAYAIDGYDLPSLGGQLNQHNGKTLYSSNTEIGSGNTNPPGIPVQVSPPNGVAITSVNPTATLTWQPVSGATQYQVVMDDGKISSPWISGTTWTTPVLSAGQHTWQVRARNNYGTSPLSVKWLLFVNTSGTPSPSPSASPSAPPASGLKLAVTPTSAAPNQTITFTGSGFAPGEQVRLRRGGSSGTVIGVVTASATGTFSVSLTLNNAPRGTHQMVAQGVSSGRQAITTFTVVPSLAREPIAGVPGTQVTVTVRGFAANETVRLNWKTANGPHLADVRTNSEGTGVVSFALPDAPAGWHDYTGVGLTSGARAWGNFGIQATMTVSDATVEPGQAITVRVRGFTPGEAVTFAWNKTAASNGIVVCRGTVGSNGDFGCTFTVPNGAGVFPVVATAGTMSRSVDVTVSGGATSLTLTPGAGSVGSNIALSMGGFAPNEQIQLRWDNGAVWMTATASSAGVVSLQATVPYLTNGNHTLSARGVTSGRQATATYRVGQSASLNPAGGAPGSSASLHVEGFPASASVAVYWARGSQAQQTLCTGRTTAMGTFGCTFKVPNGTANAQYPVTAISGGVAVTALYRLSPTSGGGGGGGPVGGGNVVGPGTYRVDATREGLVGGTTSSGHVIQPYDRFVSLPACTASSCPWLTPGVAHDMWGIRVECGSACYVRVTNPATGKCIVAPVKDVGPWYTLDDWWNPTESRFVNKLPTTKNILRQGYPAAEAARAGLDTGYGRAPSGIGISNKGYEVGNTSAIDIGDGSWVDLGYAMAGAYAPDVVVTMLWQSGESPAAAAQACGQSSPNPPAGATPGNGGSQSPKPSASPSATPRPSASPSAAPSVPGSSARITVANPAAVVGSTVTVNGTGFGAGELVVFTWDSVSGTQVRQIRASSSGTFVTTITVPAATAGAHTIYARGVSTARMAAGSVTIYPSLTRTPFGGAVGSSIYVQAHGFSAGEVVRLAFGSPNGTVVAQMPVSSNGSGGTYIRIPSLPSGNQTLWAVGLSSGRQTSTLIQVSGGLTITATVPGPGKVAVANAVGLPAGTKATVYWNSSKVGSGTAICSGTVRSDGTFTCYFALPNDLQAGVGYNVTVGAGSASVTASVRFASIVGGERPGRPPRAPRSIGAAELEEDASPSPSASASPSASVRSRGSASPSPIASASPSVSPSPSVEASASPSVQARPRVPVLTTPTVASSRPPRGEASVTPSVEATPSLVGTPVTISTPTATVEVTPTEVPSEEPSRGERSEVGTPTPTPDWIEAQPLDPTPTVAETPTAEVTPSAEATEVPTVEATEVATVEATPTATETQVPVEEATPTAEATETVEATPTAEVTPDAGEGEEGGDTPARPDRGDVPDLISTATAEATATAVPTETTEATATSEVTAEPTATDEATIEPTTEATVEPTSEVTAEPTEVPTEVPVEEAEPTATATLEPTVEPTATATIEPTIEPTPTEIPPTPTLEPTPTEVPPTPTLEPTLEPTPTMIPPTPEPVYVEVESVFTPVSDTSVSAVTPDQPQSPDTLGTLSFGGPDGAVAYVTFEVYGIAPGSVVSATLTVTGAGPAGGSGGSLGVLSGVWVDEWGTTWNTRPTGEWAALAASGAAVWIPWIEPGVPTTIDVTGTVAADGTITFVFVGDPGSVAAIASRESGAPPVLVVRSVVEQPAA